MKLEIFYFLYLFCQRFQQNIVPDIWFCVLHLGGNAPFLSFNNYLYSCVAIIIKLYLLLIDTSLASMYSFSWDAENESERGPNKGNKCCKFSFQLSSWSLAGLVFRNLLLPFAGLEKYFHFQLPLWASNSQVLLAWNNCIGFEAY